MNPFVDKVENGRAIQGQARTEKIEEERDKKRKEERRATIKARVRRAIDRVVEPLQMVRGGKKNRTSYDELNLVRADKSLTIRAEDFPDMTRSKWVLRLNLGSSSPEVYIGQTSECLLTEEGIQSQPSVPADDLDAVMTLILERLAPSCSEKTVRQASHRIP
jgi:hypothetical protein